MHACTHVCIHTYIHTYIHAYMFVYMSMVPQRCTCVGATADSVEQSEAQHRSPWLQGFLIQRFTCWWMSHRNPSMHNLYRNVYT